MRSPRYIASYIFITAGIIFVVLENGIRIFHLAPALPPQYARFINDGCLPFREKPNDSTVIRPWPEGYEFEFACKTNSQGFRDVEHDVKKPAGTFRILALGDSFTFGAGAPFEGTYPYQLGKLLNQPKNKLVPVEVINAGQRRYWPEPERLLLETIGIQYKPDLILVEFTPNDVGDTHLGMNFNLVKDGYLISREGYELGSAGVWLYVHSYLCRKIIRAYLDIKLKHLVNGQAQRIRWEEIFKPGGFHEQDWLLVESHYKRMVAIANKIGARIVFIYIPSKPYENDYALKRLAAWGQSNGVLVVDTMPAINKASTKEKVYWVKDVHCTEAGYRVVAEEVSARLMGAQLIPKREAD